MNNYSYLASDYAKMYTTTSADEVAAIGGVVTGTLTAIAMFAMLISLVIGVITIIANWKLFTKAGQKGWKCLIPIYNTVILFRIAGVSPWLILAYFAGIIPAIGWLVVAGLTIYLMYNLAKAFGKDGAFTVGLVLLNTIFMMILAFGKSEYQLNKTEVVE